MGPTAGIGCFSAAPESTALAMSGRGSCQPAGSEPCGGSSLASWAPVGTAGAGLLAVARLLAEGNASCPLLPPQPPTAIATAAAQKATATPGTRTLTISRAYGLHLSPDPPDAAPGTPDNDVIPALNPPREPRPRGGTGIPSKP